MQTLMGKDIGLKRCDFVARGDTIHEVLEQIVDHIEEEHLREWAQKEKNFDIQQEKSWLVKHIKDDDRSAV